MDVTEAVRSRKSVRAFLPDSVPQEVLLDVFEAARRTPSGGNLQPWHAIVLTGQPLTAFRAGMAKAVVNGLGSEPEQYPIYPSDLPKPYRERRFKVAEDMYGLLGVPRDDKPARLAWVAQNFCFFGAPVGMIVHMPAIMGPPQWSDTGMWMQTLMLLLRGHGLHSCAQEAWSLFHTSIRRLLPIPPDHIVFAGMAIGYADTTKSVNNLHSERAVLADYVSFDGFTAQEDPCPIKDLG